MIGIEEAHHSHEAAHLLSSPLIVKGAVAALGAIAIIGGTRYLLRKIGMID
jgi:hypothetical protein